MSRLRELINDVLVDRSPDVPTWNVDLYELAESLYAAGARPSQRTCGCHGCVVREVREALREIGDEPNNDGLVTFAYLSDLRDALEPRLQLPAEVPVPTDEPVDDMRCVCSEPEACVAQCSVRPVEAPPEAVVAAQVVRVGWSQRNGTELRLNFGPDDTSDRFSLDDVVTFRRTDASWDAIVTDGPVDPDDETPTWRFTLVLAGEVRTFSVGGFLYYEDEDGTWEVWDQIEGEQIPEGAHMLLSVPHAGTVVERVTP